MTPKKDNRRSAAKRAVPAAKAFPRRAASPAPSKRTSGALFEALVDLQATLRAPGGCPWDREQTHQSLRTFLLEEAYESLDALDRGLEEKNLREFSGELGDLLLQIIFHALLAQEAGQFDIRDVIERVHDKMVRRHPHVFGSAQARTSADVLKKWEAIKAAERKNGSAKKAASAPPPSLLDAVPSNLPALMESFQMTRRAANIGFDWDNVNGIFEKLAEESQELQEELRKEMQLANPAAANPRESGGRPVSAAMEEEMGDLLFAASNLARFLGMDPEIALRKANRKFATRFRWMEQEAARRGTTFASVSRARMEELWEEAKRKT